MPATTANSITPADSRAAAVRLAPLREVREWPLWRAALRGNAKDHRHFEVIAGDFDCRALVIEDGGAARAIQPGFFVEQDFVAAAPPALRWIARGAARLAAVPAAAAAHVGLAGG